MLAQLGGRPGEQESARPHEQRMNRCTLSYYIATGKFYQPCSDRDALSFTVYNWPKK